MKRLLGFLFIVVLFAGCIPGQTAIDELFAGWKNKKTSPGFAFVIIKDGKPALTRCYGLANLEHNIPITPDTSFQLASLSKQFTAYIIMQLENEGFLTLDDDVREYIEEFPDFGSVITIRHLLNHTSGLREQFELLEIAGWSPDDPVSNKDVLEILKRQKELNFVPGKKFSYCNTGYTLLAEIAERVTGIGFTRLADERIFKPLQMDRTFFYDDNEVIIRNRADGYYLTYTNPFTREYKIRVMNDDQVGATNLYSTIEDMAKWMVFLDSAFLNHDPVIEKLIDNARLNNGFKLEYGAGFFITEYNNEPVYWHNGWHGAFKTYNAFMPSKRLGMVILSNYEAFNPVATGMKLARVLFRRQYRPSKKKDEYVLMNMKPEELDLYTGYYYFKNGGGIVSVSRDQNALMLLQEWDDMEYPMFPETKETFFNPDFKTEITFSMSDDEDGDGKDSKAAKKIEQFTSFDATARRLEPDSDKDLVPYVGTYYSDELDTKYTFVIRDGYLVATHLRNNDIVVYRIDKHKFIGATTAFKYVTFTTGRNGINGFKVSSAGAKRVKNLVFVKID